MTFASIKGCSLASKISGVPYPSWMIVLRRVDDMSSSRESIQKTFPDGVFNAFIASLLVVSVMRRSFRKCLTEKGSNSGLY